MVFRKLFIVFTIFFFFLSALLIKVVFLRLEEQPIQILDEEKEEVLKLSDTVQNQNELEKQNSEEEKHVQDVLLEEKESKEETNISKRPIQITDGVKHSILLDEILAGGPEKDGIPSIDTPVFTSVDAADFLADDAVGLAVSLNGIDRFYPYSILVWHEIVNDDFDGQKALVTYCPLCFSGIVFDPLVAGERVAFGTSGKLWQSNLVMYDRKTDSYWSQVLGEAIVGEQTGMKLEILASDAIRFGDWKKQFPNGEVLSTKTGYVRDYTADPYGDYYTRAGSIFPVQAQDDRLFDKALVYGIVIDGQAKAYDIETVKRVGSFRDQFAGKELMVEYVEAIDSIRIFETDEQGKKSRVNGVPNFWFSWIAAHPETELYEEASYEN